MAALWSWSIALAVGVQLPWSAPLLLATGTWLIYVTDRILDGQSANLAAMRERHFFYARHRSIFLIAAIPVGLFLLWLIVARMNIAARHDDVAIFGVALLYLGAIHACGAKAELWLPKEFAVGVVFAMATAVPAWSRFAGPDRTRGHLLLAMAVAFFAALCWLNCVAIEKWERIRDYSGDSPLPHRTTQWAQAHFQRLCAGVLLAAAFAAVVSRLLNEPAAVGALFMACAMSAAGLAALDYGQHRFRLTAFSLRVAADVAMLTPLPFLLVLR